jgi:predicted RNase H-like HicB family nuclease
MSAYDYEIDVRPLAEELGGGYVAIVPELPGCMSDGETPEEALSGAYDAVDCWIAEAVRMGRDVPQPAPALRYA